MTYMDAGKEPAWAKNPDYYTAEITEAYAEVVDPDQERNEGCEAVFRTEWARDISDGEWHIDQFWLVGIVISDGDTKYYRDRDAAIRLIGYETVERLENVCVEDAAEESRG